MIVSVPARDVVYFTGDADPNNLSDMRKWTSRMLEMADIPLSRYFLTRTGSAWEQYKGHAE